jgi:protein SCO1/2
MPASQPNNAPRSQLFAIRAVVALAAVVVLGLAALWMVTSPEKPRAALIGGAFALEDGDGKTISDQTLRGRPFLVYFGYTHCPDVCPTELARISDILTKMGDKAIPALFITVDPQRDTPKIMQDYVSSFDSRIIGPARSLRPSTPNARLKKRQRTSSGFCKGLDRVCRAGSILVDRAATMTATWRSKGRWPVALGIAARLADARNVMRRRERPKQRA